MLADNYQAIPRKPSEKISAFMRSIFRPGESTRADAAAAADPVAAISDADELGAQDTIKPILNSGVAKDRPESPDSISPAPEPHAETAKFVEGEAAARALLGKVAGSPAQLSAYNAGAVAARRLLGKTIGDNAALAKYREGEAATRALRSKVVGSEAEVAKFNAGAATARALLGKKPSVRPAA